jgi:hypothetical protein
MSYRNPEQAKAYQKEYRERNKEKRRIQKAEYYQKNKDAINAKKKEQKANLTVEQIAERKAYMDAYNANRREAQIEFSKRYYIENKKQITQTKKEYRDANKEIIAIRKKLNYEKYKEKHLTQKKEYRALNKGKINALCAARKKVIKQRTPKWVDIPEKWFISEAYELAALRTKMFGFSWNVDHIIPLQGKIVSGLHVPNNLQVIPAIENIRKKNKYEVSHVS